MSDRGIAQVPWPPASVGGHTVRWTILNRSDRWPSPRHCRGLRSSPHSAIVSPLAPAPKLLDRLPDEIARVLDLHGFDQTAIDVELAHMADVALAPTNDRSVVGVMNEFAFLGEHFFDGDLTALNLQMAETPVGSLRSTHRFPDQALAALLSSHGDRAGGERSATIIPVPNR